LTNTYSPSTPLSPFHQARGLPPPAHLLVTPAPRHKVAIRDLLLGSRSGVPRPDPTPGTASARTSLALLSAPTSRWREVNVGVRCYRLVSRRCHPISTLPSVWTIPALPGSPTSLPHRVARTHPGATRRNPYAFAFMSRGSTLPRLWPTGSSSGGLPSITTRCFSSSPSDLTSR
jgi:hypothetical protein